MDLPDHCFERWLNVNATDSPGRDTPVRRERVERGCRPRTDTDFLERHNDKVSIGPGINSGQHVITGNPAMLKSD
jgi:hypothetical protein